MGDLSLSDLSRTCKFEFGNTQFPNDYSRVSISVAEPSMGGFSGDAYSITKTIYPEGQIQVQCFIDTLQNNFNYLKIQTSSSGRPYWCFVDSYTYINENNTLVTFTVDVWETFKRDLTFEELFVSHATHEQQNDTAFIMSVGAQFQDQLNFGSLTSQTIATDNITWTPRTVLAKNLNWNTITNAPPTYSLQNSMPMKGQLFEDSSLTQLNQLIQQYRETLDNNDYPTELSPFFADFGSLWMINAPTFMTIREQGVDVGTITFQPPVMSVVTDLLYSDPYVTYQVFTVDGATSYEFLPASITKDGNYKTALTMQVLGSLGPEPCLQIVPSQYRGITYNVEYVITYTNFPQVEVMSTSKVSTGSSSPIKSQVSSAAKAHPALARALQAASPVGIDLWGS